MTIDVLNHPVTLVAIGSAVGWLLIWIGGMKEHKKTVTEFMTEIREDIKTLLNRVPPAPATTNGPLRLTDYGEEISAALDAPSWAKRQAEGLRSGVLGKQPYEIDEVSSAYVREYEFSASIREAAYEHGIKDENVRTVLAIVLRDELIGEFSSQEKAR